MLQTYCQKSQNSCTPSGFCCTLGLKNKLKGIVCAPARHVQKMLCTIENKEEVEGITGNTVEEQKCTGLSAQYSM